MAGIQIDLNKLNEIIRYASLASDEIDQAQRALNKIGTNGIWKVKSTREINDSLARIKSKTNTTRGRIENFEEAVRNGKNRISTYLRSLPQKSSALEELISSGIIVTHVPVPSGGNISGGVHGGISIGISNWLETIKGIIHQEHPSGVIGTHSNLLDILHDVPLIPFDAVNRN